MKTAVEWLVDEANKRQCWADANKMHYLIAEAKELEKQQIVDAYEIGFADAWDDARYDDEPKYADAEDYYTETYK